MGVKFVNVRGKDAVSIIALNPEHEEPDDPQPSHDEVRGTTQGGESEARDGASDEDASTDEDTAGTVVSDEASDDAGEHGEQA